MILFNRHLTHDDDATASLGHNNCVTSSAWRWCCRATYTHKAQLRQQSRAKSFAHDRVGEIALSSEKARLWDSSSVLHLFLVCASASSSHSAAGVVDVISRISAKMCYGERVVDQQRGAHKGWRRVTPNKGQTLLCDEETQKKGSKI